MKKANRYIVGFVTCCILLAISQMGVCKDKRIANPTSYIPTLIDIDKNKNFYDDPRSQREALGPKKRLPKALYDKLTYDVETMKNLWAALVGFSAPEVVGKIVPEIKPGKYTWKEVQKNPAFKELMWPDMYNRIKPGCPPFAGNIPEFEIVPTRQYYWSLPIAEATKRNIGKSKLDKNGYLVLGTWKAGYPFPRPSGKFKAIQVMYNFEKRYISWGQNYWHVSRGKGYNKNLKNDYHTGTVVRRIQLGGRALVDPIGFLDKHAEKRLENNSYLVTFSAPRDVSGAMQYLKLYQDPDKPDQSLIYVPGLRRIRKMSSTDTQDPVFGMDLIYDDMDGFTQKISETRHPYSYEIIEEREYLVPACSMDGSEWLSAEGKEYRNVKMERRPVYVLKLTQLDKNYVYSYRIMYIDKETFTFLRTDNFDQKGRLYRGLDAHWGWFPEMGQFAMSGGIWFAKDYIDLHTTVIQEYELPAFWKRDETSMQGAVFQK